MHILRLVVLALVLFYASGCAIYHRYGPYYGKVVDAETKAPLEGAVVLAKYNTLLYFSPGGPTSYFLDTQEVLTNEKGEFRIPPLRKITFRPLSSFNPHPYFTIFKPKYGCYPHHIKVKAIYVPNYSLPADEQVVIELPKLATVQERKNNLHRCYPLSIPDKKMKSFLELEDMENIDLGLGVRPRKVK